MAETTEKFYKKFTETKKGAHKKAAAKNAKKEFQKKLEEQKANAEQKSLQKAKNSDKNHKSQKNRKNGKSAEKAVNTYTTYTIENSLFNEKSIPADARKIIENFDEVVQGVKALNSKQLQKLPDDIRELSHQLTDQRASRRLGYMNENAQLSAYVRYYTWWNFVRLTRLFSNLPASCFPAADGIALDLGSGPLTVISALWLARPELRKLKLTWYCLDVSANSMALGEDIYLSIAAKTFDKTSSEEVSEPWKIIRVKGSFGTSIKQKADFITCANMFNELDQAGDMPPEYQTKKYYEQLKAYGQSETKYLLIEPGVPKASRTLSLLRERFIKDGFTVNAPCPHAGECPMNGFKAYTGSQNKWCNFAFSTESAPAKLLKLSEKAKLAKERATLIFISAAKDAEIKNEELKIKNDEAEIKNEKLKIKNDELLCRVASDKFRMPYGKAGFYACSKLGLTLLNVSEDSTLTSGDLISVKLKTPETSLPKDEKSGAIKIEL